MTDERQIDEVMARYVRAADFRDPAAMAALFTKTRSSRSPTAAATGWNHWDPLREPRPSGRQSRASCPRTRPAAGATTPRSTTSSMSTGTPQASTCTSSTMTYGETRHPPPAGRRVPTGPRAPSPPSSRAISAANCAGPTARGRSRNAPSCTTCPSSSPGTKPACWPSGWSGPIQPIHGGRDREDRCSAVGPPL